MQKCCFLVVRYIRSCHNLRDNQGKTFNNYQENTLLILVSGTITVFIVLYYYCIIILVLYAITTIFCEHSDRQTAPKTDIDAIDEWHYGTH